MKDFHERSHVILEEFRDILTVQVEVYFEDELECIKENLERFLIRLICRDQSIYLLHYQHQSVKRGGKWEPGRELGMVHRRC